MRRLILGTAGHIDHGKTALIRALTGVDTDRLKEEKERGITIDLGFAEFTLDEASFGVVDVPGHEGFIRNMLAGATGVDLVLLAVAADEGVMPQTREHVAIVSMLGVERMVVALTKSDLVEPDWLELARDDIRSFLAETPYAESSIVPTSAETGEGLDALRTELAGVAAGARQRTVDDLARLPVDRVFTVKGTGTVVTGTLWSGRFREGDTVRLLPGGPEARIRGVQQHGRDAEEAVAGQRTALALNAPGLKKDDVQRGMTLVASEAWAPTLMLTCRISVLPGSAWEVEHNQRVRVHLGTAEVMARVALLEEEGAIPPDGSGWVQLRLEAPLVARGADRIVIRSYSPIETIAGAVVAEPEPPKRKSLDAGTRNRLEALLGASEPHEAVRAALQLAGWEGATADALQLRTGLTPGAVAEALAELGEVREWQGMYRDPGVLTSGRQAIVERLDRFHDESPLRTGLPLEELRQVLPGADTRTVDALLAELEAEKEIETAEGLARRAGFTPRLTAEQERRKEALARIYHDAGPTPPAVDELPEEVGTGEELWAYLNLLEGENILVALDDVYFIARAVIDSITEDIRRELGGRSGLGPSDFRDPVPVTRKHLIPILGYLDRTGVTLRDGDGRTVLEG